MKKILIIFAVVFLMFLAYRGIVTTNQENKVRNRLESAINTYPSYMTATYIDKENAFCGGINCEPRMEITFGRVSINKAEQDLRSEIVKQGYEKTGEYDYKTQDEHKLCQTIGIRTEFNEKSKINLTCY